MNIDDKIITLENNKKYIIIETINYENKTYAYLVNKDDELDSMFNEIILDKNPRIKKIDSTFFKKNIYPLFLEKFKNY